MEGLISSFKILEDFNIAKYSIIESVSDLNNLNFPYYMKIDSEKHKLSLGGVLFCENLEKAKENYNLLKNKFNNKIIIQEEIKGTELILGIKKDDVFGFVLMLGFGGKNLSKENLIFRILKLNRSEISNALSEFNENILRNYIHKEKLISFIEMICFLVEKVNIKEMDLNPIILSNKGPFIVDARIKI
ncbi:MAG: acetate--CoA ligase family protein [Candidatus Nanoarchaeia archaeon]|jgi:hypothetical protein|nr:acetate--CoA ligase family protein [Candidatus Nanoarchaeia archaeon]MDD3993586.1 acetate--CoA ligase family protein [Candidatus Nanoarchaeia archaeon]MDD4563428.1 acetate--CoA ligase family protein [Candidatus Nanoarchaeia archaeon]